MIECNDYLIPDLKDNIFETELIVKKSKFISSISHTPNLDSVKQFIQCIKNKYPDARHHCYAFNHGAANSTAFIGCSDDGEPSGTAGQPMLNVLIHSGIGEVSVVVTRYFGGTLLGTGGLVKAYQDSVKGAFSQIITKKYEKIDIVRFNIPISHLYKVIYEVKNINGVVCEQIFNNEFVNMVVQIKYDKSNFFKQLLKDITKGNVQIFSS